MVEDSKSSELNQEWENRVLCSDESCIGTIGPDGRCRECGLPYEGILPDRTEPGPPPEAVVNGDEEADCSGGLHPSTSEDGKMVELDGAFRLVFERRPSGQIVCNALQEWWHER